MRWEGARHLRFAGHVFERYCVDLATESHRIGFGATPVVSGDIPFITRQGEQRTVDLLVGMGPDLVLLEIEHHRPGLPVSVHGSTGAAARDLRDHLIHKIGRLAACITALRDPGGPNVEGLDMRRIRRIWPVVLSAEAPPQQPPLWDFLDREAGGVLKGLGAEPLTILDVEDFEMLCGVVESGRSLASILERKCRPEFARLELRVWFKEDPLAPAQRRPDALGDAFLRLMDDATSEMRLAS